MSNDFDHLAKMRRTSRYGPVAAGSWEIMKRRLTAVVGRERQTDVTCAELAAGNGPHLAREKFAHARI